MEKVNLYSKTYFLKESEYILKCFEILILQR